MLDTTYTFSKKFDDLLTDQHEKLPKKLPKKNPG